MEIIHAEWEKENIGLDVYEWNIQKEDTCKSIENAVKQTENGQYIICTIPVGKYELMSELIRNKFDFIEAKIFLAGKVEEIIRNNNKYKSLTDKYEMLKVSDDQAFDEVSRNIAYNIFQTDKYSLDPYVGVEKSNRRYINWLRNKHIQGKTDLVRVINSDGKAIGFFAVDLLDKYNEAQGFLLGVYPKYLNSGLGTILFIKMAEWCHLKGIKRIRGGTSSNNIMSLKTHITIGYKIEDIQYVYRRLG